MTGLSNDALQQRLREMQNAFDDAEQGGSGYGDPLEGIDDDDYQTRLESFDLFQGKKNPREFYLKTAFSIQHHPELAGRELTTLHTVVPDDTQGEDYVTMKLGFLKDHLHALGVDVTQLDLADIYPGSDLLNGLLDTPCLVGVYTNRRGYRNVTVRQRLDGEGQHSDLGTGRQQIESFENPKPKPKPKPAKRRSQAQQAADVEKKLNKPENCICPDPSTGRFDNDCQIAGHGIGW